MESKTADLSVVQQKYLNGVSFESLPETSIAVARTHKRNFFQKSSYSSADSEAICDLSTGASFINSRRSYLAIKLHLTAGTGSFGIGGVTNLIKRVVVTSRSGVELSRTDEYNALAVRLVRCGCSTDFVGQFGEVMGYYNSASAIGTVPTGGRGIPNTAGTARTYLIPLTLLSPFFAGDGKSLAPPQAAAGLRVQLTLESDDRALVTNSADNRYIIDDMSIMTSCTDLVDSWQRQINEESARDGLTYTYPEWHTTVANKPASQSRINIEVRKAVARVMSSFVLKQSVANSHDADNMKADAYDWTATQWRLGSLYPTQQPTTTPGEAYYLTQSMWDSDVVDCKRNNSVSFDQFQASSAPLAASNAIDGLAAASVALERNDVSINNVLNISGLPSNNSRVLAVDLQGNATASTCYLFMKHLRVAKLYLDNAVISE